MAMGLAMRVIGQRSLAEEVLQEVFVKLWRSAEGYDPARGRVRTWLLTQIHHRAVDVVRHEEAQRRRNVTNEVPLDPTDAVVDEAWLTHRTNEVRAGLATLSPDHRQVLTLAYFDGKTQTQIAAETGIPLGTVKTRTLAAMRRLRQTVEEGSR
jgi:RNA polymerase sigma factor (sigma-70 family)